MVKAAAVVTLSAPAFSAASQRGVRRGPDDASTGAEAAAEEPVAGWSGTADEAAIGPAAKDVAMVTASKARPIRDVSDRRDVTIQAASGVNAGEGGGRSGRPVGQIIPRRTILVDPRHGELWP
jgi:hypothetical protein